MSNQLSIIIKSLRFRGIAQLVERRSPKPCVEGSSPSAPAKYAAMAQVVEHILGKDEVTSSNLVSSSRKKSCSKEQDFFQLNPPLRVDELLLRGELYYQVQHFRKIK